jgi:hypothetical protein
MILNDKINDIVYLIKYFNYGNSIVYNDYRYYIDKEIKCLLKRSLGHEGTFTAEQLVFNLDLLSELVTHLKSTRLNIFHDKTASNKFEDIVYYVNREEDV